MRQTFWAAVAAIVLILLVLSSPSPSLAHGEGGDTTLTCVTQGGDRVDVETICESAASAICALSCPDVRVVSKVLRCRRVKTRADGTTIGKGCLLATEAE